MYAPLWIRRDSTLSVIDECRGRSVNGIIMPCPMPGIKSKLQVPDLLLSGEGWILDGQDVVGRVAGNRSAV